jgi:guanylate kinase
LSDTNNSGFVEIHRRGVMLVLSSPSGAGKTTISRRLLELEPQLALSVSATTRQKRPGEVAGVDYHFVDLTEFNIMKNRGEFLESAKVFDNYYATPKAQVEKELAAGRDILFDIDWQGTQQLAHNARADLVSVFILPPSTRELERRLHTRAQDSADVVAKRMAKAADEMSHFPEYDYIIVNHDIGSSVDSVRAILRAERLRRDRQVGLTEFVKGLREGQ